MKSFVIKNFCDISSPPKAFLFIMPLITGCGPNPFSAKNALPYDLFGMLHPTDTLTVSSGTDPGPLKVMSVTPADGATDIDETEAIQIIFNRPLNTASCNSASLFLSPDGIQKVNSNVSCTGATATITPLDSPLPLSHKQGYTVTATTQVQSADGVSLSTDNTSSFTTRNVIYMFATGRQPNGNLGGRSGANNLCKTEYLANRISLNCDVTTIRAFLSVNGSDEIRNLDVLPNIPVRGPTGKLVDSSFAGLLDTTILQTLQNAGVTSDNFWAGSNDQGAWSNYSCVNWTSSEPSYMGKLGTIGGNTWLTSYLGINGGLVGCDQATLSVVCLCFK